MLNTIVEGFYTLTDIDLFTALVTAGLVMTAYSLVKLTTGSLLLATIFLPFMTLGGLVAHHVFDVMFWAPLQDKDANTVFAVACGVLAAMILTAVVVRIAGILSEARSRASSVREPYVAPTSR